MHRLLRAMPDAGTRRGGCRRSFRRTLLSFRALPLLACGLYALAAPNHARAFQSIARFTDPAEQGGGGGRFFTGAPGDGYTCKVCHTVGTPPHLKISGWPVDGYKPGVAYTISIDWDDTLSAVGLNLDISNRDGAPLGMVSQLDSSQIISADQCPMTMSPAVVALSSAQRNLVFVSECGAHQARFVWTAPLLASIPPGAAEALFSGSLVAADGDGTVEGDNVTDFSRVSDMSGSEQPAGAEVNGSCSALPGRARRTGGVLWLFCGVIALLCVRSRRSR